MHNIMLVYKNYFTLQDILDLQSNLVNMNSTGPSKKVRIKRNFTLTVARRMGVIIPGDFKVVHIKRYFALNVFVLTRFHYSYTQEKFNIQYCSKYGCWPCHHESD